MMLSICLIALFVAGGNCAIPDTERASGTLSPGEKVVLTNLHGESANANLNIKYGDVLLATHVTGATAVVTKDSLGGRIVVTATATVVTITINQILAIDNAKVITVEDDANKDTNKADYTVTLVKYISAIAKTGNTTANGTAIFTCTHSLDADAKIDVYFESTRVNTVTVTSSGGTFESHNNLTSRATVAAPSGTSVKLTIANLADADNGKVVSCRNGAEFLDIAGYLIDFDCPETTTTSGSLSNAKTNMMVLAVLATFSSFLF